MGPARVSVGVALALVWGGAMLYTVALSAVALRLTGRGAPIPELVLALITLLFWGLATPAILWSARRFPLERRRWLPRAALHLVFATAFIFALNVVGPLLTRLVTGGGFDLARAGRVGLRNFVGQFHLALIVYAFILGIGHYLQSLDARRVEELRAERLRGDLAEARLLALRLQLQPHFLFNALNSVGSLIITGKSAEAFDAVGQLGDLLRGVLATEQRKEVSLTEELDLAEAYLAIEQTRLGERLRSTWEIGPETAGALLPPMLLQPLVENAIRHGISPKPEGGRLVVSASVVDGRLRLEVKDDGAGIEAAAPATRGGVGLENTRRRLEEQYGSAHRLTLDRAGGWTRVLVELPFHVAALGPAEALR